METRPSAPRAAVVRRAAATVEVAAGTIAVLLSAFAVLLTAVSAGLISDEELTAAPVGFGVLLGAGLLACWVAARRRRGWLIALVVITGTLAAAMLIAAVWHAWRALTTPSVGFWSLGWSLLLAGLTWLLIAGAGVLELRSPPAATRSGLPLLVAISAIVVPVAVIAALALLVALTVPGIAVRVNSRTGAAQAATGAPESRLDGTRRWSVDLVGQLPTPTSVGLAVPVSASFAEAAGVVMIDPATGAQLWRYQLRGARRPPELSTTDAGRAVVVRADIEDEPDLPPIVLAADTGRLIALWPAEVSVDDPPVRFVRHPQGSNEVIGLGADGRRRWAYQPAPQRAGRLCDDPRAVVGGGATGVLTMVRRTCTSGARFELVGLEAATGRTRWVQPADSEAAPENVVGDDGYTIERSGDLLRRRSASDGTIAWSRSLTACDPRATADPGRGPVATVAVLCRANQSLRVFSAEDGRPLLSRTMGERIAAVAPVDESGALALVRARSACELRRVDAQGSRTLVAEPVGELAADGGEPAARPGAPKCLEGEITRLGDTFVLALPLAPEPGRPPGVRLIALG